MNMKIIEVDFIKSNKPPVQARADVHFTGFKLNGFKVIRDPKTLKEYVTPPSYKAPQGWRKLFTTDTPEDWVYLQNFILEKFRTSQMEESASEIEEI